VTLLGKFDGEFARGSQIYAGTGTIRYTWAERHARRHDDAPHLTALCQVRCGSMLLKNLPMGAT
jgi:hypothetical protein